MNQMPMVIGNGDGTMPGASYAPDKSLARHIRVAGIALAILLLGFFMAAVVVPIGGAVIGTGALGAETRVKSIAHPTGGVISDILVKDGDVVRAGQVLVRLDTSVTSVNADLSAQNVFQLLAQRARLEAERDGIGGIAWPAELVQSRDPSAQVAMAMQMRLFRLRQTEQSGLLQQLEQRLSQLSQQISGYNAQISALQQQQALLKPERDGVRELWERELVTINRLNELERTAVNMDGQIASLRANIAETQARMSETREQAINLRQTARSDAGRELNQVMESLNNQQVRSVSARDEFSRSEIRAPIDGTIDKMAFATVGGVVQPAETIMEIVPSRDELVVEAQVQPQDIDRVQIGQAARIRLSAFNTQTTPEFAGQTSFVSAERTTEERTGQSYYRVRVTLNMRDVAAEGLDLKPGMPAEVFISTEERTIMSYLTKPIRDQLARAFKD